MKEQKWEDSAEAVKEFIDGSGLLIDDEDEVDEAPLQCQGKARVTELRRRIEERLESKRIAHEFGYDDFEDFSDPLQ